MTILDNSKFINDQDKKAFDQACKMYLENKAQYDDIKKTVEGARKTAHNTVLASLGLEKPESEATYQSLNYAIKYKKASVSTKLDENMLKEKYPEIYAECCVEVVGTPAFKEIIKL